MKMTPSQLARVHPFRGDDLVGPSQEAEGWRRLQLEWQYRRPFFLRGLAYAEGDHRARAERAFALLDGDSFPATDELVEAHVMAMLDYRTRRSIVFDDVDGDDRYAPVDDWFARRWMRAGGSAFAMRVLAAFPALGIDTPVSGVAEIHTMRVTDADMPWSSFDRGDLTAVHPLRKLIAIEPKAAYAAGLAEATRLAATAEPLLRGAFAFLYPDELSLATEVLAAARPKASKKPPKKPKPLPPFAYGLVTTKLPVADLPELLASMAKDGDSYITLTQDYGLTLVHRLGRAAAPLLDGFLAVARSKSAKAAFREALALVSPSASPRARSSSG